MTLREQVEALQVLDIGGLEWNGQEDVWVSQPVLDRQAVLDLIDAHRCALTDEVLSIIRENGDARVNAALDKARDTIATFAGPDGGRLLARDAVLAAIEAARLEP